MFVVAWCVGTTPHLRRLSTARPLLMGCINGFCGWGGRWSTGRDGSRRPPVGDKASPH